MPASDPILYYKQNQDTIKATAKAHYLKNKGKFSCEYCKKKLSTKQSMQRHMKVCYDKPV